MGSPVTYGVCFYDLPATEPVTATVTAEELGFDLLARRTSVPPAGLSQRPPDQTGGTERATPIIVEGTELLDQWAMAGAVFARTTRVCFGTRVYLAGLRHPLLSARPPGGRFRRRMVGRGVRGARRPVARRGAGLEETMSTMHAAWQGGAFEHAQPNGRFGPLQVCPSPIEGPLTVGGSSLTALRRAARMGDGWFNSGAADLDQMIAARVANETNRAAVRRYHLPFTYWMRHPELSPELSEQLAGEGFTNQVICSYHLWRGGPGAGVKQKRANMIAAPAAFGLSRELTGATA
jgi:alkanesulfonate monooxygenase SsuD/methylene tetrahydromethanopterin reductase-like flavin-dependent oxidoreductase (luciferase family)